MRPSVSDLKSVTLRFKSTMTDCMPEISALMMSIPLAIEVYAYWVRGCKDIEIDDDNGERNIGYATIMDFKSVKKNYSSKLRK